MVAAIGCSLGQDFEECRFHTDCEAGRVCSESRYCVRPLELLAADPLPHDRCTHVLGPLSDPNALVAGVVLPLSGERMAVGASVGRATTLAFEEINGEAGGVGPRARPLVLVYCDSEGTAQGARAAAARLARYGIPVAIGPLDVSAARAVALDLGVDSALAPGGLVWLPVDAPDPTLVSVGDASVWSVAPSDANWARAMGNLVADRGQLGFPTEGPVLALRPDTARGAARWQATLATLAQRGLGGTVGEVVYDPGGNFQDALVTISEVRPRVLLSLADRQVAEIVLAVEGLAAQEGFALPIHWVLPPEGRSETLVQAAPFASERVVGVRNLLQGPAFDAFVDRMEARYGSADVAMDGIAAQAYDATYAVALAYGAASAARDLRVYRPADLQAGLRRLSAGEDVLVGPEGAKRAKLVLSGVDSTVNLAGACGPMDFDTNGDPGAGPVRAWRPDPAGQGFLDSPLPTP